MTEWVSCRLADACASIDYGFTASANPEPVGPKFLRITDIVGDALRWESVPYVEGDIRDLERYRLMHEDLVIARTGATTGESYFIQSPPDAVFASYLDRLKIKQNFSPRFIAYWLKSSQFRNYLAGVLGDKSAQPNASASTMTNSPITLPADKTYQQAIASVLGALDDKIELNRRMNETLEATARAIFKDWFVDFGPTRAKMEGRAPYLAPDIWSLFPDRLDEEGKPEGWDFGTLGDVAEQVGESVQPEALDPGTPYVGLEHMPRKSIALSEWEGAGKVTSGKLTFRKGDFLFGKLRPYFHKVGIAPLDGICSTDIVVLNARERKAAAFVLACISQDEFVAFTDRTSDGTKMPRTSWGRMERYRLCLPSESALEAFNACVEPLLDRIMSNIHESRTLAATRDLLLPKLMSGEVRVKDAAEYVGKAT